MPARRALAERAAALLYGRHPDWQERWGVAGQQRCQADILYHLSYLADAVALERGDLLADYV